MGCNSSVVEINVQSQQTDNKNQEVDHNIKHLTEPDVQMNEYNDLISTPTSIEGSLTPEVTSLSVRSSTLSDGGQSMQEHNFEFIDGHAKKAPKSVAMSVENLAAYLSAPVEDELYIIRAFYVWICENIRYDDNANTAQTDLNSILRSRRTLSDGFAGLFLILCQTKNITCKLIIGYAKGKHSDYVMTFHDKPNHAWNVVNLHGSWYFIDTKMGQELVSKDRENVQRLNDFYFLTPSDQFINNHFPNVNREIKESEKWQLLENPITIEDYSKRVKLSESACKFKVKFPTHPSSTIEVNKSCDISIVSTEKPLKQISFNFRSDNGDQVQCVIIVLENRSHFTVHVRPARPGRYFLDIYGSIFSEIVSTKLVEYIVDCTCVDLDIEPYPKFQQFYGVLSTASVNLQDIKPVHTCSNGEYTFKIKSLQSLGSNIKLYDCNNREEEDCTLIESVDQQIRLRVRLRMKGYYRLEFIAKNATSFLIHNLQPSDQKISFPKTFVKTKVYQCRLIKPLTKKIPGKSEVGIEFTSPQIRGLLVETSGKCEIIHEDWTDLWIVIVNTEDTGTVKISGNTKKYGIFWDLYEFVIDK